ncbi:MAG: alkaline phosphatase family protein [Candidatus Thorarchaeota archaeon]
MSLKLALLADTDDLYVPDYQQNIYRVLPTALRCMGISIPRDDLFGIPGVRKHLKLNNALNAQRVIVCIVDSLGLQNFQGTKLSTFFEELSGIPLSSTFPSITSAAIPSINFGLPPTAHGILGHVIYFKEYGALINTLRMSGDKTRFRDAIAYAGIDVKALLWERGIPELLNETHPELIQVEGLPREIPGTGLGRFYVLKKNIITYNGFIDAFGMVRWVLSEFPDSPLFTTLYFPLIDTLAHKYGAYSLEYKAGCNAFYEHLRAFIERLPPSQAKNTTIVLCSDHGQNPLNPDRAIIIPEEELDEVRDTFKVSPGHSGRVAHFYCQSAQKRRRLKKWLQKRADNRALVLDPRELDQSGLLPTPITRSIIQRLGDLLLIARDGVALHVEREDFVNETPRILPWKGLLGSHGSVTADELYTPFIAFNAQAMQ